MLYIRNYQVLNSVTCTSNVVGKQHCNRNTTSMPYCAVVLSWHNSRPWLGRLWSLFSSRKVTTYLQRIVCTGCNTLGNWLLKISSHYTKPKAIVLFFYGQTDPYIFLLRTVFYFETVKNWKKKKNLNSLVVENVKHYTGNLYTHQQIRC